MKVIYSCLLLLAVFVASQAYSASWGRKINGDYLLSRQVEVRVPQKNNYWSINVDYPRAVSILKGLLTLPDHTNTFHRAPGFPQLLQHHLRERDRQLPQQLRRPAQSLVWRSWLPFRSDQSAQPG